MGQAPWCPWHGCVCSSYLAELFGLSSWDEGREAKWCCLRSIPSNLCAQILDCSDVYCHLSCSWVLHCHWKSSPSPLEAQAWFFSSWSGWVPCVAMTTAFGDGVWISAHSCWLIQCLWCEEATISRWEIDAGTQKMREGSGRIGCHSAMSEIKDKDLVCKLGSLPAGKWAFVLWDNVRAQSHPPCSEWGA